MRVPETCSRIVWYRSRRAGTGVFTSWKPVALLLVGIALWAASPGLGTRGMSIQPPVSDAAPSMRWGILDDRFKPHPFWGVPIMTTDCPKGSGKSRSTASMNGTSRFIMPAPRSEI